MSDWTEVEHGGVRARYRRKERGFEVEYWHEGRREWRAVRSPSTRDWFAIAFKAGQQAPVQEELPL